MADGKSTPPPLPPHEEGENPNTKPLYTHVLQPKLHSDNRSTKIPELHLPSTVQSSFVIVGSQKIFLNQGSSTDETAYRSSVIGLKLSDFAASSTTSSLNYQDTPRVVFQKSDKAKLLAGMKHVLIAKFTHGRPSVLMMQKFLSYRKLRGKTHVSNFDAKHIFIEFEMFEDFVKFWIKQNGIINGFPVRFFKWDELFDPSKESSIVPVWIHLPQLPLFLFEEGALLLIASALGRPLHLDGNNLNRNKISYATICIELDILKAPPREVWIQFGEGTSAGNHSGSYDGFRQKIVYGFMPPFCSCCCHIGHRESSCLRKVEVRGQPAAIGTTTQDGIESNSTNVLVPTAFSRLSENLGIKGMSNNLDVAGVSFSKGQNQVQGMLANHILELPKPKLLQNSMELPGKSNITEQPEPCGSIKQYIDVLQPKVLMQDCITTYQSGSSVDGDCSSQHVIQQEYIATSKVEVMDLGGQLDHHAAGSEADCKQVDSNVEGDFCNHFDTTKKPPLEQILICPHAVGDTMVAAGEVFPVQYKGESSLEEGEILEICFAKEECLQHLHQLMKVEQLPTLAGTAYYTETDKETATHDELAPAAENLLLEFQGVTAGQTTSRNNHGNTYERDVEAVAHLPSAQGFQDVSAHVENMAACTTEHLAACTSELTAGADLETIAACTTEPVVVAGETPAETATEQIMTLAEAKAGDQAEKEEEGGVLLEMNQAGKKMQQKSDLVVQSCVPVLVKEHLQTSSFTPQKLSSAAAEFTPRWAVLVEELVEGKKQSDQEREESLQERSANAGGQVVMVTNYDMDQLNERMRKLRGEPAAPILTPILATSTWVPPSMSKHLARELKKSRKQHRSYQNWQDIEDYSDEESEEGELEERAGSQMLKGEAFLSDGMGDIPRPFKIKSAPNSPKGKNSSYDSSTYLLSRRFS